MFTKSMRQSCHDLLQMMSRMDGLRGITLYSVIALTGALAVSLLMHVMRVSVGDSRAWVFILAPMWIPAFARFAATHTVDRSWRAPLPLSRWGSPRIAVLLVPPGVVSGIYLGAY